MFTLICPDKDSRFNFTFNSFSELSEIFKAASEFIKVWQETLEADVFSEVVSSLKTSQDIDNEGNFVISDSVSNVLDKYFTVYDKLKGISIDLMTVLKNRDIIKEVLEKSV